MQDLLTAAIVGVAAFACLYTVASFALFVCDRLTPCSQPAITPIGADLTEAPSSPLEQIEPPLTLTPTDIQAIDQLLGLQPVAEHRIAGGDIVDKNTGATISNLSTMSLKNNCTAEIYAATQLPSSPARKPSKDNLRRQCTERGIKWCNAHGKHKHLSSGEMLALLAG